MNVLVTGGAGYIGSQTAKTLAMAGHKPVVYDNLSRGHQRCVKWGPFVKGDIADKELLAEVFREHAIDAILHFAAFAYVGESMANPGLYFENNSLGSLRLLEAAHEAGVRNFVFSSTCATYGNPERVPISEDHPQKPVNPYGESKFIVEKFLQWFGQIHGMRWVALRYFNASGADPEGETGELHEPETHLIPLILEAVLNQQKPISVFGTDYPTPDGTAIRDYIHVSDLADAHLRALEYLSNGGESQAINLGTGTGHSVREVIAAAQSVCGKSPATKFVERRAGDPPELVADPRKARNVLKWTPTRSDLQTIIQTAWNWRTK